MGKTKAGGNSRKIGRNKIKCQRYRSMETAVKNQARKIVTQVKGFRDPSKSLEKILLTLPDDLAVRVEQNAMRRNV
jgi:hypothetical protein